MNVLQDIVRGVRADVAARMARVSLGALRDEAASAPPALDAVAALRRRRRSPSDRRDETGQPLRGRARRP